MQLRQLQLKIILPLLIMKRKALLIILLIICILATGVFYLEQIFLPVKFKKTVILKAQDFFERPVDIQSIKFNPLKGFIVQNVQIFEKDDQQAVFLSIPEISLNVFFLPFSKNSKVFIPNITLVKPQLNIIRKKDNEWNFSNFAERTKKSSASHPTLIIGSLKILNAEVSFTDENLEPQFSEKIENINLDARISVKRTMKFLLETGKFSSLSGNLSAKGEYNPFLQTLTSDMELESIPLIQYLSSYLNPKDIQMDGGYIKTGQIHIETKNKIVSLTSHFALEKVILKTKDDQKLIANPLLEVEAIYNPESKNPWQYNATMDMNSAKIVKLPLIDDLTDINGKIRLETDKIYTEGLSAKLLDNPVELSGSLSDFTKPYLKVQASSLVELAKLKVITDYFAKNEKIYLEGNALITADYQSNLPFSQEKLNIAVDFQKAKFSAQKLPWAVEEVAGKIHYADHVIFWDNLDFSVMDIAITSSGRYKEILENNIKKPYIDLQAFCNIDLERLKNLSPEFSKKTDLTIAGKAQVSLVYAGPMEALLQKQFFLTANLNNVDIHSEQLSDTISHVNGKMEYSPDLIAWKNLNGDFRGHSYALTGTFRDFSRPIVDSTITSDHVDLSTQLKILNNAFQIIFLKGKYLDSTVDIKGDVRFSKEISPQVDLEAILKLETANIPSMVREFAPEYSSRLEKVNLAGTVDVTGSFKGLLNEWRNWHLVFNANSPLLNINGYGIKDISIQYQQTDRNISHFDITGFLYNGSMAVTSSADLTHEQMPATFSINLQEVNLSDLTKNTGLKDKEVSGFLSLSFLANGPLKNFEEAQGSGSIMIKEGRIWQMSLLEGLGQFLFIPEYKNIVFTEASGDFILRDKRISSEYFELKSEPITFLCTGWLDLDGRLNLDIASQFNDAAIAQSESFKKVTTQFLAKTGDLLNIQVTGTVKEPQYTIRSSPINIIKKATGLIFNEIENILR